MQAELFWIPGPWRGRLAITLRPRGGEWLSDEAGAWRRAGIDTVISLLEDDEAKELGLVDERMVAKGQAIEYFSFPIPDRGVPPSKSGALSVIGRIATQLEEGKNVAMHCRQGIGRSGLVAAAVLMTAGIGPEEAMRIVSSARGTPVPETPEQRRWIEQLSPRVPVTYP
jgi:protein-tyrosine phosphatase